MTGSARIPSGARTADRLSLTPQTALVATGILTAGLVGALLPISVPAAVGVLSIAILVPVALVNLPLGVALWVPFAFIYVVPGVDPISTGLLGLLVVACLAVISVNRHAAADLLQRNQVIIWILLALTAWVTLSIIWATDPDAAAANIRNWYTAIAAFALVAATINRPRHLVLVLVAIILSVVLAAAIGYAPAPGAELIAKQDGRLSGGLGDPNYLAAAIVAAMALAAGLIAATRSRPLRGGLAVTMIFLGVSLAATGSRGGMIAAVISAAAALAVSRGSRARLGAVIAVAVAVAGIWIAAAAPETLDRIREADTSGTGRVDLWDVAWRMSEDHPWLGVGTNNFRAESPNYVRQPGSPNDIYLITENPHVVHNIYLQQLTETGIIGLVLLLALLTAVLRTTWRAIARLETQGVRDLVIIGRSILVAQVGTLSASVFLSNAYEQVLWILLALGPVLGAVAARVSGDRYPAAESRTTLTTRR